MEDKREIWHQILEMIDDEIDDLEESFNKCEKQLNEYWTDFVAKVIQRHSEEVEELHKRKFSDLKKLKILKDNLKMQSKTTEDIAILPTLRFGNTYKATPVTDLTICQQVKSSSKTFGLLDISKRQLAVPKVAFNGSVDYNFKVWPTYMDRARHFNFSFEQLQLHSIQLNKLCELPMVAFRMTMIDHNFWIPVYECDKERIEVVSVTGECIRQIKIEAECPQAVQQVGLYEVIMASLSGLYVLATSGEVLYKALDGQYCDVSYFNNRVVTLECESDNLIILMYHKDKMWKKQKQFQITYNDSMVRSKYFQTVLACEKYIYVSQVRGNVLLQYSWTGDLQREIPISRYSFLCGIDERSRLLTCSYLGRKLNMLSDDGICEEYDLDVVEPTDVLIVGSSLHVLHGLTAISTCRVSPRTLSLSCL